MRSMVEGHARQSLPLKGKDIRPCPSTTFGGPPPRSGEEWRETCATI
jgi:hypothetical protein